MCIRDRYCKTVSVFACMLVMVEFVFSISYVTNLALWLREFNKLTYLLTRLNVQSRVAGRVQLRVKIRTPWYSNYTPLNITQPKSSYSSSHPMKDRRLSWIRTVVDHNCYNWVLCIPGWEQSIDWPRLITNEPTKQHTTCNSSHLTDKFSVG